MATPLHNSQTIALLGSTGKTGREVLRVLLKQDQYNLKIYVRSREKIAGLFPHLPSNPRVQVYVGAITDQTTMQECLSDAALIICTI